jgi:sarcosine oxidase subunit beta
MRYSLFNLVRNAAGYHEAWPQAWRAPEPRSSYDVIIVGAGGHGLAAAYYLAKEHGITNVAVVDKGWLGGGNTGRNTTVVRSNYLWDESAHLYEFSLQLWEALSQDLNYNVMFSQRGVVNLAFSEHEMHELHRRFFALRRNGIDAELLDLDGLRRWVPRLNLSRQARYPIIGGIVQPRGGTARHDAVAWGYARGADARGAHILQHCPVTAVRCESGRAVGVETSKGFLRAGKVALSVAGHSSVLAATAGLSLPLQSYPLQAFVSEPIKPVLDTVINSGTINVYVSQSDKGELVIGGARDGYVSYAQRGSIHVVESIVANLLELFPSFSRLKELRQWAGIVDVSPDASPIVGKTPVDGLYLNCGWGTGGFKATPGAGWLLAHAIAKDAPHPLATPFALERFATGRLVNEAAAAGVGH